MSEPTNRPGEPQLAAVPMDDTAEDWELQQRRTEKRVRVVSVVEYSQYPRARRDQRRKVAYTRDESVSGMGLTSEEPEAVGTLLRVANRGLGTAECRDALARVCWCSAQPDGRYRLGLRVIEKGQQRMLSVRREGRSRSTLAGTRATKETLLRA
jgi:hypothetical protein